MEAGWKWSPPNKNDVQRIAHKLRRAVNFAKAAGEIKFSTNAAKMWNKLYRRLTTDIPGLTGVVTSRAEAQVRRIALIYALLDLSPKVRSRHLGAALEIWRFCEDSAKFIFSKHSRVSLDTKILKFLRASRGLTRTQISEALQHHVSSSAISSALKDLKNEISSGVREPRLEADQQKSGSPCECEGHLHGKASNNSRTRRSVEYRGRDRLPLAQ